MKIFEKDPNIKTWFFLPLLILFVSFMLCKDYVNVETNIITVRSKYIKDNNYYVITDKRKKYIIKNVFPIPKDSEGIYRNLEIGETYEIESTGYDIRDFNSYKNINKFKLIKENN